MSYLSHWIHCEEEEMRVQFQFNLVVLYYGKYVEIEIFKFFLNNCWHDVPYWLLRLPTYESLCSYIYIYVGQ